MSAKQRGYCSDAPGLSFQTTKPGFQDCVLGLCGGVGQTGSEATLLDLFRSFLAGCEISASQPGPLVGVFIRRSFRKKIH